MSKDDNNSFADIKDEVKRQLKANKKKRAPPRKLTDMKAIPAI